MNKTMNYEIFLDKVNFLNHTYFKLIFLVHFKFLTLNMSLFIELVLFIFFFSSKKKSVVRFKTRFS